jgi:hypothetical protein
MRLVDLNPRFVGSGGQGISQPSDRPCAACHGTGAGCEACHSTGKEYEPAPVRVGVGLMFDCPCVQCTAQRTGNEDADFHLRQYVPFRNPLDGGAQHGGPSRPSWERTGETFDTLVLRPSILRVGDCGWHGFVGGAAGNQPGEVVTV